MAIATFSFCQELFGFIDNQLTFVSDMASNTASMVTQPVSVGLVIAFVWMGFQVALGHGGMGVGEFLVKSVKVAIIVSFALSGGLYQGTVANAVRTLPDQVASAVTPSGSGATSGAQMVDQAAENSFKAAGDAWEKGGFMTDHGMEYWGAGAIMILASAVTLGIGAAYLLITKVCVALLAALGPLFIVGLLFRWSSRYFEKWLGAVIGMALLTVLLSAIFAMVTGAYAQYTSQLAMDGGQNMAMALGGLCMLAIIGTAMVVFLPMLATHLSDGVNMVGGVTGAISSALTPSPQSQSSGGGSGGSSSGGGSNSNSGSGGGSEQSRPASGHARGSKAA